MEESILILPGETIPPHLLPPAKKNVLTLGPGLRHLPPSEIVSTSAGILTKDVKKGAAWLELDTGRYVASTGDLVVAQVHHSSTDVYYCMLAPHTSNAILGQLNFEGASRKSRPQLKSGDVVYARVARAVRGEDAEIECVNSATGKADGLGPLKAGMLFNVSLAFARRLMQPSGKGGIVILDLIGEKWHFEVAVGRNGVIWIDSASTKMTIAIGQLLCNTDQQRWEKTEQEQAVKKAIRDFGG